MIDKRRVKIILHFLAGAVLMITGFALPFAHALTPLQAGPFVALVRQETSGTDNIYTYALVANIPRTGIPYPGSRLLEFAIGTAPVDPSSTDPDEPSVGTLTRLPTGTTWSMAPEFSLDYPTTPMGMPALPHPAAGSMIPIPAQGSVTTTHSIRTSISGAVREPGYSMLPEDLAEERYAISWIALRTPYSIPAYSPSLDVVSAVGGRAGEPSGLGTVNIIGRVRVPQDSPVGPGSVGSLANYTQGDYEAVVWGGMSWMGMEFIKTTLRGKLIIAPSALVSFTSDLPGNEDNGIYKVSMQNSSSLITVTANIMPLHISETVPTIRLESIACRGECLPSEGVSGAAFGTDDRMFQLQGSRVADGLPHNRYFDITYLVSSIEGTNRATSTVMVQVTNAAPLGAPSSLTVPATSNTGNYTVSWGAASGTVTRYELEERTEATFTTPIIVYSGTNLSANFTGKSNETYFYRVRACNASGCSNYKTTAANSVLVHLEIPPGTPASLSFPTEVQTSAPYRIDWGVASGEVTRYELEERQGFILPIIWTNVYRGPNRNVTLAGKASLNTSYLYRIRACNSYGCSSYRIGTDMVNIY